MTTVSSDSGSQRALDYARGVLDGTIATGELVRLACKRFASDLDRDDVYLDVDDADRHVRNIERLPHVKGPLRGKPIHLEGWQCFIVVNLFGWKWTKTKLRRFREAYIQVGRKNGKTLLAICIALELFAADLEPGAEVYLGATSMEHAKDLLFLPAREIVQQCPKFKRHWGVEVNATSLVIPETFSRLKSVIKKPDDGYNPHCAVVDEYHHHETDEQWATFQTGLGARSQPLLLTVTTAGSSLSGPCKEYRDDCARMLSGEPLDSRFAMIYEPDADDDWDDPASLAKANPNMGVSVSEDYLLDQVAAARQSASMQNGVRTKHLNQWVGSSVAWLNQLAWARQKDKKLKWSDFSGHKAFLAVDLASKKDAVAITAVLPRPEDSFYTFSWFFAPEGATSVNERYRKYQLQGCMELTPGNATDYDTVMAKIVEVCGFFDVQALAFDEWNAQWMMQKLHARGLPVERFPQTRQYLSDPMKEVEALILDRRLWHNGNPCMTDMMSDVMAKEYGKDIVVPIKARPSDPRCKIDGPVTLIMAVGLAIRDREQGSLAEWLADPVVI